VKSSFAAEINMSSSDAGQALCFAMLLVDRSAGVAISISIEKSSFVYETNGGDDV
jgi:hypothetical protein